MIYELYLTYCILCHHPKLNMPGSLVLWLLWSGILKVSIYKAAALLFYISHKRHLFSQLLLFHEFTCPPCCCRLQEIKTYWIGMSSRGISFIPSFVKMVNWSTDTHTQHTHSMLISKAYYIPFRKESFQNMSKILSSANLLVWRCSLQYK